MPVAVNSSRKDWLHRDFFEDVLIQKCDSAFRTILTSIIEKGVCVCASSNNARNFRFNTGGNSESEIGEDDAGISYDMVPFSSGKDYVDTLCKKNNCELKKRCKDRSRTPVQGASAMQPSKQ